MDNEDQADLLRKRIKQEKFTGDYKILVRENLTNDRKPPRPIHKIPPFYPPELKELGITGTVLMWSIVDETGRVVEVAIEETTDERFNEVAIEAYLLWRFEPAEYSGERVASLVRLPMSFTLK